MAIDELNESASGIAADAEADEKLRIRLDRLFGGLETQLEVADIQIRDPRFRWIAAQMTPPPAPTTRVLDILRGLAGDERITLDDRLERLGHVRDYVTDLEAQDLEDELTGILGVLVGRTEVQTARLPAMMRRFGWDGRPPGTLEDVGELLGVTRERVRQIEQTVDAALRAQPCWTPVLDRAVRILAREAPIAFDRVGPILTRARLTPDETFAAESILSAQSLLSDTPRLTDEPLHDVRFLIRTGEPLEIPWFSTARSVTQRRVSNQGIAEIAAIVADAASEGTALTASQVEQAVRWTPRWHLLDGHWIVPTDLDARNPLLNRIRKVLSVAPGIALPTLFAQLNRYARKDHEFDVPMDGVRAFVQWHPDLALDGHGHILPVTPILPDDVLSDSEMVILETLGVADQSVAYATVVEAMEGVGLTKVVASVSLRDSPIVVKVARNAYCLVKASSPPEITTLGEDQGTIPDASDVLPEDLLGLEDKDEMGVLTDDQDDGPDTTPTEARAAAPLDSGPDEADYWNDGLSEEDAFDHEDGTEDAVDDALAQRIIAAAISQIAARGCTTRAEVVIQARKGDQGITPPMVREVLEQTEEMIWLDGDWVTCFAPNCDNPLRNRIDELTRKDRRITPNTIRPHDRAGASIPDRVYKRLIDRYAAWRPIAPARPAPETPTIPEAPFLEPIPDSDSGASLAPDDAVSSDISQGEILRVSDPLDVASAHPLRLFDPVETQPKLPIGEPHSTASGGRGEPSLHSHTQIGANSPHARDDRLLLESLSAPELATYYDTAAANLGLDPDELYAAFDLIPPDIVRWLRGNASRSRMVRNLMTPEFPRRTEDS